MKLTFALLAILATNACAYTINVGANDEECLYENIDLGVKAFGSFQVAAGGFLDIDLTVQQNRDQTLHWFQIPTLPSD